MIETGRVLDATGDRVAAVAVSLRPSSLRYCPSVKCRNGHNVAEGDRFCPKCGQLIDDSRHCPNGHVAARHDIFCAICGAEIADGPTACPQCGIAGGPRAELAPGRWRCQVPVMRRGLRMTPQAPVPHPAMSPPPQVHSFDYVAACGYVFDDPFGASAGIGQKCVGGLEAFRRCTRCAEPLCGAEGCSRRVDDAFICRSCVSDLPAAQRTAPHGPGATQELWLQTSNSDGHLVELAWRDHRLYPAGHFSTEGVPMYIDGAVDGWHSVSMLDHAGHDRSTEWRASLEIAKLGAEYSAYVTAFIERPERARRLSDDLIAAALAEPTPYGLGPLVARSRRKALQQRLVLAVPILASQDPPIVPVPRRRLLRPD